MNFHGAEDFLRDYPGMSFAPMRASGFTLRGTFSFTANYKEAPSITDSYSLKIFIPEKFPHALPQVTELNNKIPRDFKHHINPDDTLCVGSPFRVLMKIHKQPTINKYAEECLVPYLYAMSHKLTYGGEFIFGELKHGDEGVLDDYLDILGLDQHKQTLYALELLGKKKRVANKMLCPCECGKRLGVCPIHNKINELRRVAHRSFFKKQLNSLRKFKI